jgi:hypothetical protein
MIFSIKDCLGFFILFKNYLNPRLIRIRFKLNPGLKI